MAKTDTLEQLDPLAALMSAVATVGRDAIVEGYYQSAAAEAVRAAAVALVLAELRVLPCTLSGHGHPCQQHYEDRPIWCPRCERIAYWEGLT